MINLRCLLCALVFCPASLLAQDCNNNVNATTPVYRFVVYDDGTATDSRTDLRWQRCPVGYELNDKGTGMIGDDVCELRETATFNWQDALQSTEDLNNNGGSAGFTNWRLPSIKELVSIVEFQCFDPAINLAIFPDAVADNFWSSTPRKINSPAILDFQFGTYSFSFIDVTDLEFKFHVRLVRDEI